MRVKGKKNKNEKVYVKKSVEPTYKTHNFYISLHQNQEKQIFLLKHYHDTIKSIKQADSAEERYA